MAQIVTVEGEQYKKRSPWGVWGLSLVTLGIFYFVWHYKVNDEARRFLGDQSIRPVLSLLALFVPIVNLVSIYRTGQRISRMEERVGTQRQVEPILGLLGSLFFFLHVPYYQQHLNGVWDSAAGRPQGAIAAPQAPGPPAVPPPPPPQA